MTIHVGQANFEVEVLARSRTVPVVVDFWAPWCNPCRTLGPILEQLEREADGRWVLAKINTDQEQQLAGSFGIRGIPAVKAFVNGEMVDEFVGALPRPQIEAWLDKLVPAPSSAVLEAGEQALEAGDLEAAVEIFRGGLDDAKTRAPALAGLARAELARGDAIAAAEWTRQISEEDKADHARTIALVELAAEAGDVDSVAALEGRIAADPRDVAARYDLGVKLAVTGDFEGGLNQLLEVVFRDRQHREDGARKAMVRIFEILGHETELATRWRKKLGAAMY